MKKLITKIRHKLIRWLGGEILVPQTKPLIISETVPLSVIEARQYIPAERYKNIPLTAENIDQNIEMYLENKIGEEIVKACGVKKGYDAPTDTYCFRVAVEVTGRSFKREGEK